jgi:hypothetical protein
MVLREGESSFSEARAAEVDAALSKRTCASVCG